MPGRDPEPEYVGKGARPAVGQGSEQRGRFGGQDRLVPHTALEIGQPTVVVTGRYALDHPGIDQSAGEPDAHPGTPMYDVGQLGGNQIVEWTIQMR